MTTTDGWAGLAVGSMPSYYCTVYSCMGTYYSAASGMMPGTGVVASVWTSSPKM